MFAATDGRAFLQARQQSHRCIFSILVNEFPVLKADAIKYVMIFRSQVWSPPSIIDSPCIQPYKWNDRCVVPSQLPKEQLLQAVPLLMAHLGAESAVEHTYAAHALERLFTMRGPNNSTL